MQDRPIDLVTDVASFQSVFFKEGQGSIFQNNITKKPLRAAIVVFLICTATYFLGIYNPGMSWLFVLGILSTLTALFFLTIALNKYYKWKKEVTTYLQTVSEIKKATLKLNEHSFELQVDDRIIIQPVKWVKKIDINPEFIWIDGHNERFLFPARSMCAEDFTKLTEYLCGRVH